MRVSSGFSRGLVMGAAAAALMMAGAARADEGPPSHSAAIGVGMICNSAEQAEQFVALRAQGSDAKGAMETVNKQARDPHACGLAAIAFTRDATLENKAIENKLVQVVRINVVAGFNGSGWQRVSGMIQYAVMEGEGETI